MRASQVLLCLLVVFVISALPLCAASTERVNVSNGGEEASFLSTYSSVSSDGRYVAFDSSDPDLVANDTNGTSDVFVRDRQTGQTIRVSVASDGTEGDAHSGAPCISADGRYITFYSLASNLVVGDSNGQEDAFVHDIQTGETTRVSVSSDGTQGLGNSTYESSISADGRYVAFWSACQNLVPDKTDTEYDIFLHDRQTGETERVSVSSDEEAGNSQSQLDPSRTVISADGRYVVFTSSASNLVPEDTNGNDDAFVRDREAGVTYRVSVASDGTEANGYSSWVSISDDGRFVAFYSGATNLVVEDTNSAGDVFVHDLQTGETERVSVATDGVQGNEGSYIPCISGDGRFVAFQSYATNLVPDDTNGQRDVFLRDREAGVTVRVSVADDGGEPNAPSYGAYVGGDGRFVTFASEATNLVADDTNGVQDIFLRDRETFPDMPVDSWAFHATEACVNAGIVGGYPEGDYRPSQPVTRGQMAVFVARGLAGGDEYVPDPGCETDPFTDVACDHWARTYIQYCVAAEVAQGYPEGDYKPDAEVDRGQMAVFVARAMAGGESGVPDPGCTEPVFSDVDCEFWARKYIQYLKTEGVTSGYPEGDYKPTVVVTRDQMAVYVARAFGLVS